MVVVAVREQHRHGLEAEFGNFIPHARLGAVHHYARFAVRRDCI